MLIITFTTFQAVCDENMVFLDIVAGWPGSVHDSRVLRNSGLYQTAAIKFPGDTLLLLSTWRWGLPFVKVSGFPNSLISILKYIFTQKLQP